MSGSGGGARLGQGVRLDEDCAATARDSDLHADCLLVLRQNGDDQAAVAPLRRGIRLGEQSGQLARVHHALHSAAKARLGGGDGGTPLLQCWEGCRGEHKRALDRLESTGEARGETLGWRRSRCERGEPRARHLLLRVAAPSGESHECIDCFGDCSKAGNLDAALLGQRLKYWRECEVVLQRRLLFLLEPDHLTDCRISGLNIINALEKRQPGAEC